MRLSLIFLAVLGSTSALFAQGPLSCQRIDTPQTVRAEGTTELVSDIVLQCSGGSPSAAGAALPKYQVIVASSVPLTSRILVAGAQKTGLTEGLLLVDEPSFYEQSGCDAAAEGSACPALAGAALNPNVFQGRLVQANTIAFRNITLDPPGTNQSRKIRITNIRADVAAASGPIQLTVQMFDGSGSTVAVREGSKAAAEPKAGVAFSVRTLADTPPALKGNPVLTIPPASLPVGAPQSLIGFNVKFTEGFIGAFRRRNVATSPDSPLFMTVQAVPGLAYSTESGFLNTQLPATSKMDTAGLADTGTRLYVRFQGVPKDTLVWVTARDVRAGTTQFSELNPRALLTKADANGGGMLTPLKASLSGLVQVPVVNGIAMAVWEVVSASPATLQTLSFGVAISAQTAAPGQGLVTATGGLAPFVSAPPPATTVATEEALVSIPMFQETAKPMSAFAVSNLITVPPVECVSAASFLGPLAAPSSIVSVFGSNLSPTTLVATEVPPSPLLGLLSVDLVDTAGNKKSAPMLFVSPSQVNFVVSPELEAGPVLVNILSGGRLVASGYLQMDSVAPALFTANGTGSGVLAGEALVASGDRSFSRATAVFDSRNGSWMASPVSVGRETELLFLTLYGTGIRGRRSLTEVRATVGSIPVPVTYAGPQEFFTGLDQVNIGPLPRSLAGRGLVDVVVSIGSHKSNPVQVHVE